MALGHPGRGLRILVVDNYDSFVFNLVQYLGELGAETVVWRNDAGTVADVRALDPDGVVISPGPGHPRDARLSVDVVRDLGAELSLLHGVSAPLSAFCLASSSSTRARRRTLPIRVLGSSSRNSTDRGTL